MQFVAKGPDIPDALLQAHEDGRVVFFCGAGISYPAGLPGFKGLVDEIYRLVGSNRTRIEQDAYSRGQFDATLDLLERRLPGQRIAVRTALAKALQPNLERKGATDTHSALLQLARIREGALRLVTTNFDRIFEFVSERDKIAINMYSAPLLPIPKNSRWDGLVYLHGLLPAKTDESALHRLVFTSGDFGLAYLTERWAARFVSELFRNYIVCFVGYSISDPVLRYMMDALAADRMLGEATPKAYALGDYEPGQKDNKVIEWEAKGVMPVLYEVPTGTNDHSALHHTLKAWTETYRDGILGKERIVVDYAMAKPSASTQQDDFVGRMLWALSHESGLPAKRFADFNPVPPLEWLEAITDDRYRHNDLDRFDVSSRQEIDKKLRFSLIRRPAPYTRSPWMSVVSGGALESQWDDVMFHMARWLLRHLNDPALVIWLAQRGGQLHDQWSRMIEHELDRFARLDREGKKAELDEIRANAPNAIPQPLMQTLWRLLLNGRVKSSFGNYLNLYSWKDRLQRDGLTVMLRLMLREVLAPKVVLKKPFRWGESDEKTEAPKHLRQLIDSELVLADDHVHSSLQHLAEAKNWRTFLPILLGDFQQLLRDALDLSRELGDADDLRDRSHWDLPSISPHWQNRGFHDWISLIELLRDAWIATSEINSKLAARIAQEWFELPYPTFKRLALFAATQESSISADQWVGWLKADDSWWLWSVETQREVMRLFVLQSARLAPATKEMLETAILGGPPQSMFKPDIKPEDWQYVVEHSVWLRLAKLQEGNKSLSNAASHRFNELSSANPGWRLASDERDEFSHWMSGTGDPDYEEKRVINIAPRRRQDLVNWLKQPRPARHFPIMDNEDNWSETCRRHFCHSLCALSDLAQEGSWPEGRWRDALQAWSEKGRVLRPWRFAAPLVQTMPDEVLLKLAHAVTWWLETVSKSIDRHESIFLDVCSHILALPHQDGVDTNQPVTRAINHPVGHVAQAMMNLWFKRQPNDNDNLPPDIEPLFTRLCDTTVEQFRHGRVLLASRLVALFRVDRPWTETHLLPLFDWSSNPTEAKAVWEGFLWSPRLYRELLIAFKPQFLNTALHYAELGEHSRQFAAFLTYAGLDPVDGYLPQDFRSAIAILPQEGLHEVAQALWQSLEGAGEQREEYWKNRIQPFWHQVWPKSRDLVSNSIAESLTRLSLAARDEFPSALSAVQDWLQPIEHPHYVVHLLYESGLSSRFPEEALRLLSAIIDDQPWAPDELRKCLTSIVVSAPALEQNPLYQRLAEYSRRRDLSS